MRILLFSEGALFKYNVSTILSPIAAIASAYVAGPVHFLMLVIKEGDLRRIFLDTPDLTSVIPVSDLLP